MSHILGEKEIKHAFQLQRLSLSRSFPNVDSYFIEEATQMAIVKWLTDAPPEVLCSFELTQRWLTPRAFHYLVDLLRRHKKLEALDIESDYVGRLAIQEDAAVDARRDLDYALPRLAKISFEQLVTIVFHDLYARSFASIAAEIHCTEATAMTHHSRAMINLRKIMGAKPLPHRRRN